MCKVGQPTCPAAPTTHYSAAPQCTGTVKQLFVQDVGSGTITGVTCRHVVNAAGLGAVQVASSLEGVSQSTVPKQYLAKGTYFSVQGTALNWT